MTLPSAVKRESLIDSNVDPADGAPGQSRMQPTPENRSKSASRIQPPLKSIEARPPRLVGR